MAWRHVCLTDCVGRQPISGDETTDPKLLEENKKLRGELRKLRQENMQMKEEGCKQRILSSERSSSSSGSASATTAADLLAQQKLLVGRDVVTGGQQEIVQLLMNPNVLAIAVVFFAVGVVIGKLLF